MKTMQQKTGRSSERKTKSVKLPKR
uniref:Uncharacterized protein n=1 Tax=Arundo donax TaxID=35708 RepID=A0A0A9FCT6_ARUDO